MKRLISCTARETAAMDKQEKLLSIRASEGRVIASEMIPSHDSGTLVNASIGELYASFGADILLLNMLDVDHPCIPNIPSPGHEEDVRTLKRLTGRLIGINLEPVDEKAEAILTDRLPEGRKACARTALRAKELGADLILLTGNPGTGVDSAAMIKALREIREAVGKDLILAAGKMHAAGCLQEGGASIIDAQTIRALRDSGADILLFPAPGTVPGVTMDQVREWVSLAHSLGCLTITSIGTSQEDSDLSTIRRIALLCKMTGTDIHHLGDGGLTSCVPESLLAYSVAIRGRRHAYSRMASSILR